MNCFRVQVVRVSFAAVTVLAGTAIAASQNTRVAMGAFEIGGYRLGASTIAELQSSLGTSVIQGNEADLLRSVCYYSPADRRFVVAKFQASVLGGLERLTGFSIQFATEKPARCSESAVDLRSLAIGIGITLGQSERDFRKLLPVKFARRGIGLIYEVEYRRPMTGEEQAVMRRQWADLPKQSFFDVMEFVEGKFANGTLDYYEVRRSESF